MFIINKVMQKS